VPCAWVAGFTIVHHGNLDSPGPGYVVPIRTATGRPGLAPGPVVVLGLTRTRAGN